jgi:nitrous oxidase accessory protein NosD
MTAGPHGTVIVEAGIHTESSSVVITDPVTIIGEEGAVIEFDSDESAASLRVIDAGIHVKNTRQVHIRGLVIRDNDVGSAAILLEGSEHVTIKDNRITNFQFGVLVESADHTTVDGNHIGMSSGPLSVTSFGILVVNGFGNHVRDNTVSEAAFGIFASGENGKVVNNTTSYGFVGVMLCNLPANIQLPDGNGGWRVSGSAVPATGWLVQGNVSTHNSHVGYLVIDKANHNVLTNNQGGNNRLSDIELTADSFRFGFLTPAAFDNVVNAGPYKDITIKDCGNGNRVHGGIQVDTSADPCF